MLSKMKFKQKLWYTWSYVFIKHFQGLVTPSSYDALAHYSQPLSALIVSPHEKVFHIRPRNPLTFDLNLNRNKNNKCVSQYCSQLPEHSHYDKTDLNPFFYKPLSKSIAQWFLAVETAM